MLNARLLNVTVWMFLWHHPRRAGWARAQLLQPGARARRTRRGSGSHISKAGGEAHGRLRRSTRAARAKSEGPAEGPAPGRLRPSLGVDSAGRPASLSLGTSAPIPPHSRPRPGQAPRVTRPPPPPRGNTHFSPEATSSLPSRLPNASVSPRPSLGPGAGGAAGCDAPGCGGGCCCCCCCCCVPPLPSSWRISEGELDKPRARSPAGRPPPPHHGYSRAAAADQAASGPPPRARRQRVARDCPRLRAGLGTADGRRRRSRSIAEPRSRIMLPGQSVSAGQGRMLGAWASALLPGCVIPWYGERASEDKQGQGQRRGCGCGSASRSRSLCLCSSHRGELRTKAEVLGRAGDIPRSPS